MNQAPFSANPGSTRAAETQGPPRGDNAGDGVNSSLDSFANDPRLAEFAGPLPGRRRRFTNDEKRRFLEEAMSGNESMSSIGRRYGLSVSLLFRWRRQLDGTNRPSPRGSEEGARAEARELREKVRELERLLGKKTLEAELLKQELTKLGHNPTAALSALEQR